jgi:hypothetical protein
MPDIVIKNLTIPAGDPVKLIVPHLIRWCPEVIEQIGLSWDTYFDFHRFIRIEFLRKKFNDQKIIPSIEFLKRFFKKAVKYEIRIILHWLAIKYDCPTPSDLRTLKDHHVFINKLDKAVQEALKNIDCMNIWKRNWDYQSTLAELIPVNQLPLLINYISSSWNKAKVQAILERRLKEGT